VHFRFCSKQKKTQLNKILKHLNLNSDSKKKFLTFLSYFRQGVIVGRSDISKNPEISPSWQVNRINGVMVSVLALSAVDRRFELGRVKTKTLKLVFVASTLSTQH
jgi:hypothetical protein